MVTLDDIEAARRTIAGRVLRTPLLPAPPLSALTNADIFVKYENLQVTNSFKERGACVKLASLTAEERRRGVIAMSAGNHAQAVAYHARRLGIPATIVMPEGTPFTKIDRTEALGAKVVLRGAGLVEARQAADALVRERGLVPVHPYDDYAVIAGQGTIALEMLADRPDLDVLVVPIGGGGLIAGIALAAKALKPAITVLGVEVESYPAMAAARRGVPARFGGATLAEGIAVKRPGRLTLPLVERYVDDILLVSEARIEEAIELLIDNQNLVV